MILVAFSMNMFLASLVLMLRPHSDLNKFLLFLSFSRYPENVRGKPSLSLNHIKGVFSVFLYIDIPSVLIWGFGRGRAALRELENIIEKRRKPIYSNNSEFRSR